MIDIGVKTVSSLRWVFVVCLFTGIDAEILCGESQFSPTARAPPVELFNDVLRRLENIALV